MNQDQYWEAQWLISEFEELALNTDYGYLGITEEEEACLDFLLGLNKPEPVLDAETDEIVWMSE